MLVSVSISAGFGDYLSFNPGSLMLTDHRHRYLAWSHSL